MTLNIQGTLENVDLSFQSILCFIIPITFQMYKIPGRSISTLHLVTELLGSSFVVASVPYCLWVLLFFIAIGFLGMF